MAQEKAIQDRRTYEPGKILIKEGDAPSTAFLIQSGKVQVYRHIGGNKVELAILGPGEIVGEMALISHKRHHSNSVETIENTTVVIIDPKLLEQKFFKTEPFMKTIIQKLVDRLDQANENILELKKKS